MLISKGEMMVRIAELEIDPITIDEYINILKEEAEASVRLEPGVICIYPMYPKRESDANQAFGNLCQ